LFPACSSNGKVLNNSQSRVVFLVSPKEEGQEIMSTSPVPGRDIENNSVLEDNGEELKIRSFLLECDLTWPCGLRVRIVIYNLGAGAGRCRYTELP